MTFARSLAAVCAAGLVAGFAPSGAAQGRMSDAEVRQTIIRQSIASYSGNCPCPYSTARNGSRCGGRSAYSRPGGAAPTCYPGDMTAAQVAAWRRR